MLEHDTTEAIWTALFADIKKDIATSKPASLLLFTTPNLDEVQTLHVPNAVSIQSTEALIRYLKNPPAKRRFDLAIVIFATEDIKDERYIHLISKLRDTDCAKVYLAYKTPSKITDKHYDTCFRTLGFKRLRVYGSPTVDKMTVCLYYYDIYDYKEVPDWLNDRFWAHPDMWDKARW